MKALKVSNWSTEILIRLAEQFQANIIALLYRLKDLKIIDYSTFQQFERLKLPRQLKKDPELKGLPEK